MPDTLEHPASAPKTDRVNRVPISKDVLDVADFNERIVGAYNDGTAELGLPADLGTLRSFIPAGTGVLTLVTSRRRFRCSTARTAWAAWIA